MNPTREILEEKISKCYKSPFKEYLSSLIRPGIGIKYLNCSKINKYSSRIGGIPLLRDKDKWPRSKNDNKPLLFICQVNLKEITVLDLDKVLPEEGVLNFYFSSNNWTEGLVTYYLNDDTLKMAELPIEYQESLDRAKLSIIKRIFKRPNPFQIFNEKQIEFELDFQCPSYDSVQVELFERKNQKKIFEYEIDEYLVEKYFLDEDSFDHHLLGYYLALQESQYERPTTQIDWTLRPVITEEILTDSQHWRILLKIGSDSIVGMDWVDGGNLFFFIKDDDLKENNFRNIKAYLDTT